MDIKRIRMARGLSQEEFAKELGVCSQCVSNWETGNNKPSLWSLKKLIEYCRQHKIKIWEES